ncbi:hypothetical protein IPM19_00135 [bacterium]|nr:MAG: hypothetical protein IPM19_00135 [bacterium]
MSALTLATSNGQFVGFDPATIPQSYLRQLRIEIIQEIVRDGANEASIKLRSEMTEAENSDPVLQFVMKLIVESWLISHGYRMIPDGSVSSSIRLQMEQQAKRRNSSMWVRVIDAIRETGEKTRTELIEQNEALAAINEALKTENSRLELDNAASRAQAAGIINTASEKSTDIIANATEKADSILSKTRKESSAIISTAQSSSQQLVAGAMQNRQMILEEITRLEDKLLNLKAEVGQKQNILSDLDANPEVVAVYQRLNSNDSGIKDVIMSQIEKIKYDFQNIPDGYYSAPRNLESIKLKVVLVSLYGFQQNILMKLCEYETIHGAAKRVLLMPSIITGLAKASGSYATLRVGKATFSKTVFSRSLRCLLDENQSPNELLLRFNDLSGSVWADPSVDPNDNRFITIFANLEKLTK